MICCDWLPSLNMMFLRIIHVVTCIKTSVALHSFYNQIIFHYINGYMFHVYIHQLRDIWVVSTFWLLWVILPLTFVCKFLWGHMFSFLLDVYVEVDLLSQMVTMFNFSRKCQTVFSSTDTILHSNLQCLRVLISPYLH